MRVHPISDRNRATAADRGGSTGDTISQQKPPLHTNQQFQSRNENAINEIMEVATEVPNVSLAATQKNTKKSDIDAAYADDDDDDFMTRIVDGTCRGIFPSSGNKIIDINDKPSLCHLPSCHLGESLDMLMHCRQPMSFLTFFHEVQTDEGVEVVQLLPAGAYLLPTECEYCGKSDTKSCCPETCKRPIYYLQKKRPPFSKPNIIKWDPISDHAILRPPPAPMISSSPRSPGSWVSDLFRRNGGDGVNH